ncbi:MAG: hypothetical protein HYU39_06290 [Thaumarchaeota archaeon]|nr:hypothetical protein [Nitrososphaerota archaeon]
MSVIGPGRGFSIEDFLVKLGPSRRDLFELIRGNVLGLGSDVVEDVRMHRVVYGRGAWLRSFAELRPTSLCLEVCYRVRRDSSNVDSATPGSLSVSWRTVSVSSVAEASAVLSLIREAYLSV